MPYFHIFGKFRELLMASEYVIFAGVGVMDCVLAPDVETIRDSDQLRSLARNVTANVFTSTLINTCLTHPGTMSGDHWSAMISSASLRVSPSVTRWPGSHLWPGTVMAGYLMNKNVSLSVRQIHQRVNTFLSQPWSIWSKLCIVIVAWVGSDDTKYVSCETTLNYL